MFVPTPGSLRFARQRVIWFLKYTWLLFSKVSVQELTGIAETSLLLFATTASKQLLRDARVTFHHQNVSIPMACTAISWWLSGAKRSSFALLRQNLIWIDIWNDKKNLSHEIPQLKVNLNVSKGSQLTNSMGKLLYPILNVAWTISKKTWKISQTLKHSKIFKDIPSASVIFTSLRLAKDHSCYGHSHHQGILPQRHWCMAGSWFVFRWCGRWKQYWNCGTDVRMCVVV